MLYFEDFMEAIENLPSELNDSLTTVRHLDLQTQNLLDSITESVKLLFEGRKHSRVSEYESDVQYSNVCKDYECALLYCKEKRDIVENIYGMYRKLVKKLDSELEKFRLELEADNSGITEQIERRIHNVLGRAVTSAAKAERRRQRFRFQQAVHCKTHLSVRRRLIGQAFRNVRKSSCFRPSFSTEPSHESIDASYAPDGGVDFSISTKHLESLSPISLSRSQDTGLYQDFFMHGIPPDGTPKFGDERDSLRATQALSYQNKEQFPDPCDPNTSGLMPDSPMRSDEDSDDENLFHYTDDNPSISLKTSSFLSQDSTSDSVGLSTTGSSTMTTTKGLTGGSLGLSRYPKTSSLATNHLSPYDTPTSNLLNTTPSRISASGFDNRSASSSTHPWSGAQQSTTTANSATPNSIIFSSSRDRRRICRRSDKTNLSDDLSSVGSHTDDLLKIEDTTLLGVLNDCIDPSGSYSTKLDPGDGRHDVNSDIHTTVTTTTTTTSNVTNNNNASNNSSNDDEDCKRYCICHDISYGDMIACDAPDCPYEWFHYACVNLTVAPKGRWFCPNCIKSFANLKHSKKRVTRK